MLSKDASDAVHSRELQLSMRMRTKIDSVDAPPGLSIQVQRLLR